MCGLTGSGKTTFAKGLEREHNAVRFSIDEWMIELYGHHMPREVFDARFDICKTLIFATAEKLLALGINVVLDFGFWKRDERAEVKAWLKTRELSYTLYYFDIPLETLWERLQKRNQMLAEGTFEITREMLETFASRFEAPTKAEGLTLKRVTS